MKNAQLFPDEFQQVVVASEKKHRQYFQVGADILEASDGAFTVRITQTANLGKIYTADELHEFGKQMFKDALDAGIKIRWRPVVFKQGPLDQVTVEWVKGKMDQYGVKQKQLAADLGLTKEVVSRALSGEYAFTKWHRAAFYYYFQSLSGAA